MRLIQDGYRPGRVDVERRRADCAELSPLLESDLRRAVSPCGQRKPHVRATGVAERVAAECDVDWVLEWAGHMRRVGASGRDGDSLTEIGCLELRVVLEATGLRGERVRNASGELPSAARRTASVSASRSNEPRPALRTKTAPRTSQPASAPSSSPAAQCTSYASSARSSGIVRSGGRCVASKTALLLWAGPLRRGGAERYRRDTGGTADHDSENQCGQSPTKRLFSSHVALLCSLVRQQ